MIKRLSNIITAARDFIYRHTALRIAWLLLCIALMLAFWLAADAPEVSFVYNAF